MRTRDLLKSRTERKPIVITSDAIRPDTLGEFIGQDEAIAQLTLACHAAKARGQVLENVLLVGPGGLGKTTLALAIAHEMGGKFIATTGSMLNKDNLVKMLTTMERGTVLFIDEGHDVKRGPYELLYAAMEDGWIDTQAVGATERVKLPPFTVVLATTLPGRLEPSFKTRFGLTVRVDFYRLADIETITERAALILGCAIDPEALEAISDRSKDIPRVALALLRRCRDYAQVHSPGCAIGLSDTDQTFRMLGIDEMGLDRLDQAYLMTLRERFQNGPVGLINMARALGEDTNTLSGDVEPFLIRRGLIVSTPRGRMLTTVGRQHVADLIDDRDDEQ